MTTHVAYLVTLEEPVRNHAADATLTALSRIKGVVSVEPVGNECDVQMAKAGLRQKMLTAVVAAVKEVLGDGQNRQD